MSLLLRWRNSSGDIENGVRLVALIDDTANVPSDIIEKACDRWRLSSDWMPTSFELRTKCRETMAPPASTGTRDELLAERAREYNLDNMRKSSPMRWTAGMQLFRIGDPGEHRVTDAAGNVRAGV